MIIPFPAQDRFQGRMLSVSMFTFPRCLPGFHTHKKIPFRKKAGIVCKIIGIEGDYKKNNHGKVKLILCVVTVFIHVRAPFSFSPQIIFLFLDLEPLMGTKVALVFKHLDLDSVSGYSY